MNISSIHINTIQIPEPLTCRTFYTTLRIIRKDCGGICSDSQIRMSTLPSTRQNYISIDGIFKLHEADKPCKNIHSNTKITYMNILL